MANEIVVGDLTIGRERASYSFRTPTNDNPTRNVKAWKGRLFLDLGTNFNYDDDTGIPAATVSGDVVSAGVLYSMGLRRLSNLIAVRCSYAFGSTNALATWASTPPAFTAGGANVGLLVAFDMGLGCFRLFQADVDVANTPDRFTEVADNSDLRGGDYFDAMDSSAFIDVEVEFYSADGT